MILEALKGKVQFAVCSRCEHFQNLEPGSPREDVWYNHLCKASPLPTARDPYDGTERPYTYNSLGMRYFTEHGYNYCRDVNTDGKCSEFQRREET